MKMQMLWACLAFCACANKATSQPPAAAAAPPTADATKANANQGATLASAERDLPPDATLCHSAKVAFEYDSATLTSADRTELDRVGRCLRANQRAHVLIEGNADERGTEEYNLALGERRAQAVRGFLQLGGVSTDQLRTLSYGKNRPLCQEHTESCWAKNRRADVALN